MAIPDLDFSPKVRAIPLPGFESIILGVLHSNKMTPLLQALLDELKTRATGLRGASPNS